MLTAVVEIWLIARRAAHLVSSITFMGETHQSKRRFTMSQQPCLPVPLRRKRQDGSEVYFSDIESMDANEYIAAVVQQASSLPDVFVADNTTNASTTRERQEDRKHHVPIDGSAASLNYLVSERTAIVPPPTKQHAPPSREWVDATLANFSELRAYLDKCHKEGVGGKGTERSPVPALRDRSGWHVFCVGLDEARGNVGSYFDEEQDSSDVGNDDEITQWRQDLPPIGYSPSVRLLLQMDQVMVRRVLSHLVHYVRDGWSLSKQRSAWLYALLARLDRPIHRDDAATLYGLLKELTVSRAHLVISQSNSKRVAQLNTLITIVGLYFEQGAGYNNVMAAPDA